jgi:hypothetical protein
MTPFQQAVSQHRQGLLRTPEVTYGSKQVDYFGYQLSTHLYGLRILACGLKTRLVKLKDLKAYYGLTGRTASDCVPQLKDLIEDYKKSF